MALTVSYRVPVNGTHFQYPLPHLIKAMLVQNLSQSNLNVSNLVGTTVAVPPGLSQTVILTTSASQFEVWTDANTTGEAWLYGYDSPADLTGNPNLGVQQVSITNATLNVAGTVTANIAPGSTINIGNTVTVTGNVNATITNTVSVNATITNSTLAVTLSGTNTVNAVITGSSVTLNTTELVVEQNTGILTGLLPSTTTPFTITNNQQQNITVPYACPGFGITSTIGGFGRLNIWLTSGGNDVYLLRDQQFSNGALATRPVEKRFAVPMAKNDVLHVRWDDATVNSSHVVRF